MDFFGIGPWEILLILIIALIVVGPGRLPEIARTLGKTVRAVRRAGAEMTTAVTRELEAAEKAEKAEKQSPLPEAPRPVKLREDSPTEPGGATPTQ
jgi:sec-independent protein translocase protein TatA